MLGLEGRPLPAKPAEGASDAPGDVRPNVVVSQCLGFAAVRYNGQILRSRFVDALREHVYFVQVCPEVGMGLGVPRDPVHIEEHDGGLRMVQPDTGRDLTDDMAAFAGKATTALEGADGFILKSRSPSCGIRDTKIYGPGADSGPRRRGSGLFAEAVRKAFPWAAVQDEGSLTNLRLRHHFLTHLWALARLRSVEAEGTVGALVAHHASYKFLLMTFGPDVPARLGRIVANPDGLPARELVVRYRSALGGVMEKPAGTGNTVNALQHVFGFVSGELSGSERTWFLERLEDFRAGSLSLPALLAVLHSWVLRFDEEYLAGQRFFEPYPRALFDLSSSGDGRVV